MSYVWTSLTVIYLAGVAWGLIMIDASHPGVRIGHALLWPLGPLAFVVTIGVLLVAAMIAFPAFGAVALAAGVALWMLAR